MILLLLSYKPDLTCCLCGKTLKIYLSIFQSIYLSIYTSSLVTLFFGSAVPPVFPPLCPSSVDAGPPRRGTGFFLASLEHSSQNDSSSESSSSSSSSFSGIIGRAFPFSWVDGGVTAGGFVQIGGVGACFEATLLQVDPPLRNSWHSN